MTKPAECTRVYNWGSRMLGAVLLGFFIAATLGGIFDPTPGPDKPTLMPGALVVALELFLLVRALRLGVTVTPERVVSRGWLLTRRYPIGHVSGAGATGYSGGYNRWSRSKAFTMLWIGVDQRAVDLPHIAGRPHKIHRLADELQVALSDAKDDGPQ